MAMSTVNNEENKVNEGTVQQNQETPENVSVPAEVAESKPKKKIEWKSIGKKALICVGGAAALAGAFLTGKAVGEHSSKSTAEVPTEEPGADVEVTEF